ncbi:kinase-like domain-containing protein [Rhizophagus irregularis DAOM 181602=DAOM 197198]|nr:kinase-like domain-containing protein [Rhizophagus irregularis DAOM 181602=DAOM 197198]
MKECWDVDPLKRPDADALDTKIQEQEAFHSKFYNFNIPDNINNFNKSNKQNNNKSSKIVTIFRDDEKEITQQQIKGKVLMSTVGENLRNNK